MPGTHAPASPRSFYLSLLRAGVVLAVATGVLVSIVLVATGGDSKKPGALQSTIPSASTSASASPAASIAPAKFTVVVFNTTGRQGLAKLVAARITAIPGFSALVGGNETPTNKTTIYVRNGATAAAETLRRAAFPFVARTSIKVADATSPGAKEKAMLTVVLGLDYPGDASPKPSATKKASSPPTVSSSTRPTPSPTTT